VFGYIKEYYNLGLYTVGDLDIFVQVKWITTKEKNSIINAQ
jgi:hypothetical protein